MSIFRFAPSPNGYLHLGHALSALINDAMARAVQGRFLLRIEDIDTTRCRPEFVRAIEDDLAWLGLSWEQPVRRQSEHLDVYREALAQLAALDLIYPSFESRADIGRLIGEREAVGPWPRDPDGAALYPGSRHGMTDSERRQRMASGEPHALRLDMHAAMMLAGPLTWTDDGAGPLGEAGVVQADPAAWGDVVLARKDMPTSYHLSVVVDDAVQGITHVVRGRDLFWSTSVHRLLQALLKLPAPIYHHHRLVLGEDGRKLSKSSHATALRDLRNKGVTPIDVQNIIGITEI